METRHMAIASCSVRRIAADALILIASLATAGCMMEDLEEEEPGLDELADVDPGERIEIDGLGDQALVTGDDAVSPSAVPNVPWVLRKGQRMLRNQKLSRPTGPADTGRTDLIMQADGNLVLYAFWLDQVHVCWESATQGGTFAKYQGDGNFVVYNAVEAPLWASNTAGNEGNSVSINAWGQVWVGWEALTGFCTF